jgi:glycosyltransferase involved in cell wall biosynthesis
MGPKPSICIIAHFAYGAMTGGSSGHVGGVERQTSITARWLAQRGYPVTMITWDNGQDNDIHVDGVRMLKMCRQDAGIPGLRFFVPRWSSLVNALQKADADLYYHNCAEYVTGQVAMWCRRNHKVFVFSTASNMDCEPSLPEMKAWRVRALYRYGLKHADTLIAQTEYQKNLLRTGFGLDSIVLPMPCPGPSEGEYLPPDPPDPSRAIVVWIGRIIDIKRLEWFLDVAEALPDLTFKIVGGASADSEYVRNLMKRAESLTNVVHCGLIPREQMPEVYKHASLLCCTSKIEGLPNTFLEAWSHGLPVVSTFDPDGWIQSRRLGITATDVNGLVNGIRKLINSPHEWRRASDNGRRHYVENHTPEVVLERFEKAFLDTARRKFTSRA